MTSLKIPKSKRRLLRLNHLAHVSSHYVDVVDFINAACEPVIVNDEKYYLADEDQRELIVNAIDRISDLIDNAADLKEVLEEILVVDF